MEIILDDFGLEWKRKDGIIHKADYGDLIVAYENQKTNEKEIRDMAIEELSCKLMTYFADCQLIEEDVIVRDALDGVIKSIDEIAEQMKEVG